MSVDQTSSGRVCIVVDDRKDTAFATAQVLREAGCGAEAFCDPDAALAWVREHPGVVRWALFDYHLGDDRPSGLDSLRRLVEVEPQVRAALMDGSGGDLVEPPEIRVFPKPLDYTALLQWLGPEAIVKVDPKPLPNDPPPPPWWRSGTFWSAVSALAALLVPVFMKVIPWPAGHAETVAAGSPVKIVLSENPIPISSLTILATKRYMYQRHNLSVESKRFSSGREALDALLSGSAQFATVAETPIVLASFESPSLAVIATMAESDDETKLIVCSNVVSSPQDLKGKKVGTVLGTNAEYFMNIFLKRNGLRLGDLSVVNLSPASMVAALSQGDLAGYFVWQPFIYQGMKLTDRKPVSYSGRGYYTMTFNIVTSKEFVAKSPKTVKAFLLSLRDADKDLRERPAEAIATVAEVTGMDPATLQAIWPNYRFGLKLDSSLVRYMQEQAAWAKRSPEYRLVGKPDFASVIAPGPLRSIDPAVVTLQ